MLESWGGMCWVDMVGSSLFQAIPGYNGIYVPGRDKNWKCSLFNISRRCARLQFQRLIVVPGVVDLLISEARGAVERLLLLLGRRAGSRCYEKRGV